MKALKLMSLLALAAVAGSAQAGVTITTGTTPTWTYNANASQALADNYLVTDSRIKLYINYETTGHLGTSDTNDSLTIVLRFSAPTGYTINSATVDFAYWNNSAQYFTAGDSVTVYTLASDTNYTYASDYTSSANGATLLGTAADRTDLPAEFKKTVNGLNTSTLTVAFVLDVDADNAWAGWDSRLWLFTDVDATNNIPNGVNNMFVSLDISPVATPEPASLGLLAIGGGMLLANRKRN